MRILDAAATRAALPFQELIPALRALFAAGCVVPPRHLHEIGEDVTSLLMPAWTPGRHYGVKIVNIAAGNAARGLPALHASYLLHDASTGAPLALIDGDEITARRTAAASALAASWSRPGAMPAICWWWAPAGSRLLPCGLPRGAADRAGDGLGATRRRGRGPGASAGRGGVARRGERRSRAGGGRRRRHQRRDARHRAA